MLSLQNRLLSVSLYHYFYTLLFTYLIMNAFFIALELQHQFSSFFNGFVVKIISTTALIKTFLNLPFM